MSATTSVGLDGVIVARSSLASIDGTAGYLRYSGYNIHDLVQASWEEVVYLLWNGDLPNQSQLAAFKQELASQRALSDEEMAIVRAVPRTGHGMDALRSITSLISQINPEVSAIMTPETVFKSGAFLLARIPTALAAWIRLRDGKEPVAPDPELDHASNLLYMIYGRRPTENEARAINTYMILLAEHSLNVSTFTGRVVTSAQNDLGSAITAAIAALKGLSHGSANEFAMRTFLDIGSPERAEEAIDELLARKERLMGVGHRIYKTEDPRVRHLRTNSAALAADPVVQENVPDGAKAHAIAERVSQVVINHPHFQARKLFPNVEFYSAPLLYQLGLPLDCFTAAFACSRLPGWTAHIREQLLDNRLMRPSAEYIGPEDREFVPLAERK
jgi:Citrate synthase